MENRALPENSDQAVGAVNNVQLVWNVQSGETFGLTAEEQSAAPQQEDPFAVAGPAFPSVLLPQQTSAPASYVSSLGQKRSRSPEQTDLEEDFPANKALRGGGDTRVPGSAAEEEQRFSEEGIAMELAGSLEEPAAETTRGSRPQLNFHLTRDRFNYRFFDTSVPGNASAPPVLVTPSSRSESEDTTAIGNPMKHRLDITGLQRLTIAILRRLGVVLTLEELSTVQVGEPDENDSRQVLPVAAMQVITAMILGTSGDKDVSQTEGSQISNGDLVAIQRLVIGGLRLKNIFIQPTVPKQLLTASATAIPEPTEASTSQVVESRPRTFIDLSYVRYDLPINVTRLFLRIYRFILNMLFTTPDCWPFVQPVPASAFLYHQEIKYPMDLSTVEQNVWRGKYTTFAKFEKDILLIWRNAKTFHRDTGTIPKHADKLNALFRKTVQDLKTQIRAPRNNQQKAEFRFDPSQLLPEEFEITDSLLSRLFTCKSTVYTISAMSPNEEKARQRGLASEKQLYLQLNGPFFEAVQRMKEDPIGNHAVLPRFYIAKNRTILEQAGQYGVLAIFYNTRVKRSASKKHQVETDIVVAYPASRLYDIVQLNEETDEFAPKAWIHLRPLRIIENATFEVNEAIDRDYFRRMYATGRISPAMIRAGNESIETKRLLRVIARTVLSLTEEEDRENEMLIESAVAEQKSISKGKSARKTTVKEEDKEESSSSKVESKSARKTTVKAEERQGSPKVDTKSVQRRAAKSPSGIRHTAHENILAAQQPTSIPENTRDVWVRLFEACRSKGVDVANVQERYKNLDWCSPNSEGFFKQVYFLEDVVVQMFRQMTMYQRITEVACLMKLRNLPHMAQMREVMYNDRGDVVGLSMERYQITLKQYAHVHSHHRLTAHQKYNIIHQMLVCMKTIHEAGLAHRDLSEVNFMVNKVDGQLEDGTDNVRLYLIDFGKAVFCRPDDVREWFVDVPRAEWEYDGDVVPETKEELDAWCETLPWVKGKPDHGYRMYRSIQTLPKTRTDNQVLPWLIHPQAEDVYSIGVLMWKIFAETEPWRGILDTDLQGLRYVAEDDYRIERALQREVHGELSRQLLLKCLKTRPQDRATAAEILEWITREDIKAALLEEWKKYSSENRASRKAKTMYGFEDGTEEEKRRKKRQRTAATAGGSRGRGRPRTKAAAPSPQPPDIAGSNSQTGTGG